MFDLDLRCIGVVETARMRSGKEEEEGGNGTHRQQPSRPELGPDRRLEDECFSVKETHETTAEGVSVDVEHVLNRGKPRRGNRG